MGGGVLGMAAAYYLAREGLEVTLVEAGEIGRGCSKPWSSWRARTTSPTNGRSCGRS